MMKVAGRLLTVFLLFASWGGMVGAETLEEAWKAGLAGDHLLRAARERIRGREADLAAAKGGRLPTVNLGGGYTVLDNEPVSSAGNFQFAVADSQSLSYQAMLSLPLYTGNQVSSAIDAASANLEAGHQAEEVSRQKEKLAIAEAYVAVLLAESRVRVAQSHETGLKAHADDVANLFAEGMVPQNDLLAAQVAHANARQLTLQALNGLDIAKAAYNRLLGRPLEASVELEDLSPQFPEVDLSEENRRALENRAELHALVQQSTALKHRARAVRGEALPHLALQSGYGYKGNSHMLHEGAWQAALTASWDIFDGNIAANRASALEADSKAVEEERLNLEGLIRLQVRRAWLDLQESRKRIEVSRSTLDQAKENLAVTRNRYQEGIGTNTEVLDAESLLTVNRLSFDKATNDAVLAGLRLRYADGSL